MWREGGRGDEPRGRGAEGQKAGENDACPSRFRPRDGAGQGHPNHEDPGRAQEGVPRGPLRPRACRRLAAAGGHDPVGPVHRRAGQHGDTRTLRGLPRPRRDGEGPAGRRGGDIQSTGFFRNKAKNLIAMASALETGHGAKVPRTMAELHALPGVGRKTANVVLGNAFGINEGITVDTHVARIARLLGLTRHEDPGEDRAGPDGADSPRGLDPGLPPADLARAGGVHCPQAPVRRVRDRPPLSFSAGLTPSGRPRRPLHRAAPPAGRTLPRRPPGPRSCQGTAASSSSHRP